MGKSTQPGEHSRHDSGGCPHSSGTLLEVWTPEEKVQLGKGGTSFMVGPPPPNPSDTDCWPWPTVPIILRQRPHPFLFKGSRSSPVGEMLTCLFKWLAVCILHPQPRSRASQCRCGWSLGDGKTLCQFSCPQHRQGRHWIASLSVKRVGVILGEAWQPSLIE